MKISGVSRPPAISWDGFPKGLLARIQSLASLDRWEHLSYGAEAGTSRRYKMLLDNDRLDLVTKNMHDWIALQGEASQRS